MYINGLGLLSFKPQINIITKLVGQCIIFKNSCLVNLSFLTTAVWLIFHLLKQLFGSFKIFKNNCLVNSLSLLKTVLWSIYHL